MKNLRVAILLAASAGAVFAFSDSKADTFVSKINALTDPRPALEAKLQATPGSQPSEKDYQTIADWAKKRDGLILDLYAAAPSDPRSATFLEQRWFDGMFEEHLPELMAEVKSGKQPDLKPIMKETTDEIDKVLATHPSDAVQEAGRFVKVEIALRSMPDQDPMPQVNQFVQAYPHSKRVPDLLMMVSSDPAITADEKTAVLRRIVKDYPSYSSIDQVKAMLRITDAVNKPFDLKFTDAVSGKAIDIANMKGKIVLVDFWATWCGPCVQEMPIVKDAYAKYHGKGLEIIGVSLDRSPQEGGLKSLKAFVKENGIPWVQYYQGNYWESKFSSSWGIQEIPTMFVVNKQGNFVGPIDPREDDFDAKLKGLLGLK
jgi:thiol-disulfide isomerase/thioredoxin